MSKYKIGSADIAGYLTATVIVLVPFHALLTVWASTLFGHFLWLRLWDETLLAVLVVIVGYWLARDAELRRALFRSNLMRLIAIYGSIASLWGFAAYLLGQVSLFALGYGLVIDLRFFVWFVAVWIVASRSEWLYGHRKKLVFWPLAVVVGFGLLQFFVLPQDFLVHFGYGTHTFAPFTTLNQDSSILRIQSTIRGPNQLGMYLAFGLTLLVALLWRNWRKWRAGLLIIPTFVALLLTFSRGAWFVSAVGLLGTVGVRLKPRKRLLAVGVLLLSLAMLGVVGTFAVQRSRDAQNIVFHVTDQSTAQQTSNQQHSNALETSLVILSHEPLGRGPGTSGSASWYNTGHPIRNPESLLFQVGEETGWLGLGIFLAIILVLSRELWRRRHDPLVLALVVSLAGLTFVSFVSYTWADDTLAFVWWGLAAIALRRR